MQSFRLLNLPASIMDNLASMRLLVPTEIQQKTFKPLYEKSTALMMGETGSGKTLAYTLPIVSRLLDNPRNNESNTNHRSPRAVMIMPNSGLARQTFEFVKALSNDTPLQTHLLQNLNDSAPKLPFNTDILVTNMNSMSALMETHASKLFSSTETVVVDEADWVLSEGFPRKKGIISPQDVISTLKKIKCTDPENPSEINRKQFIFTCATLPRGPKSPFKFIENTFHGIPVIYSSKTHRKVSTLQENWISFSDTAEVADRKENELLDIIKEATNQTRIIVFANTIQSIERVYEFLKDSITTCPTLSSRIGLHMIHSKVSPVDRQRIIDFFTQNEYSTSSNYGDLVSDSKVHILVAGDMVARGYDFREVSKIVQYEFPTNVVSYLHRVGRAARGGKTGEVVNFITDSDSHLLKIIRDASPEIEAETVDSVDELYATKYAKAFSRNKSLRKREQRKNKL